MDRPLANHTLPVNEFDALARGGGGPETIRLLWQAEYSRRLLLLRALLDLASARPDLLHGLPTADAAWRVFSDCSSESLREVLLYPNVGNWLSYALRQHSGGADPTGPEWAEIGQVHAVALAAAIRAGRQLHTWVPVRHGYVLVPTLGIARFPETHGFEVAEAKASADGCWLRVGDQVAVIPPGGRLDGPAWWSLRTIRCGSDSGTLSVTLDDLDYYRNLADPVAPERINGSAISRWRQRLDVAWMTLTEWHPETAAAMAGGLVSIAPLADDPSWLILSASTGDGFGGALVSLPADPVMLAMTMVHEFQHIKLGGLLHLTPLLQDNQDRATWYAPWRPDPRPMAGLLQGVYAFFGIAEFWRRQRVAETDPARQEMAAFEFAYARRQTWIGLGIVARSALLTEMGVRFVEILRRRLRPWLAEPVPGRLRQMAGAALLDHRAGWRIRHMRADQGWVLRSARRWQGSNHLVPPAAGEPDIRHDRSPWIHGRLMQYRLRLTTSGRLRGAPDPESRLSQVPNAMTGDLALLNGDAATAAEIYSTRIVADADDFDAWTGLGLAQAFHGGSPGWRALLWRPELVHALYCELVLRGLRPTPSEVASRVAGGAPKSNRRGPSS
jgi:HEXXH motif-containing protein